MIDWLYGLQHFGMKLGLDNITALLKALDHPYRSYKTVLVAGTNGKGSVAAMLESMFRAGGKRTGLFTSPHLVRPNERLRLDGQEISDGEFHALLASMRDRIEAALAAGGLEAHPSFFEVLTASGLLWFQQRGVDVALLEVGLGGRLDASNAVDADLGVIVSIGLDHTKSLGPTLGRIAREKAGIVKPGRPLISGAVQQVAIDAIRDTCAERDAEYVDARLAVRFDRESAGDRELLFRSEHRSYEVDSIGIPGRHQIDNARVAVAAFERLAPQLGMSLDSNAVTEGLRHVKWGGRLQWREAGEGYPPMLFDAAHNPDGLATLTRYLDGLRETGRAAGRDGNHEPDGSDDRYRGKPVLLFGATSGKSLHEMLGPFGSRIERAVLTQPAVKRGVQVGELIPAARTHLRDTELVSDVAAALRLAVRRTPSDGWLLVTGSLYLVGQVLGLIENDRGPGQISL